MKKRTLLSIWLFFVLPISIPAQEGQLKQEENTIFCAQFDIVVNGFELSDSAKIYVCCGEPFAETSIPCKILNKANYESFSGQSDAIYNPKENGFLVAELLVPIKNKIAKLKEVEVIASSTNVLHNSVLVTIKKGKYVIDNEGTVWLEVEYIK